MRREIPAPGYVKISGTRSPPKSWGTHLWCQIRGTQDSPTEGWCAPEPWPVEKPTRWAWERDEAGDVIEHPGDIVAVKRLE